VHHLKPIHQIGSTYKVDPINDLRPVCPNCHAMLHRQEQTLKIEDLKKIIAENITKPIADESITAGIK
jgi:5-methylcytosine-specific restriction protein A